MALVKMKDFKGSLVANEVTSDLHNTGLTVYIKSFGYNVDITPIMGSTPEGMIEDSPDVHVITLIKNIQTNDMDSDNNIIVDDNRENFLQFNPNFKYNTKNIYDVWVDKSTGTRWCTHKHSVEIKRQDGESNSDYALRIVEFVFTLIGNRR